jgi:hypothetical protein
MPEQTRELLKNQFRDGDRPPGAAFASLIDSGVNKQSDGVSFDIDGNLLLNRGVRLGDSNGNSPGGLRFNSNQLQVFTGGAWVNVASGSGAFQAPTTTPQPPQAPVAYNGNVGIGAFTAAAAPTFRLEVPLGSSGTAADQVRFGNVVCGNGTAAFAGAAVFSHQNHASNSNYALRQTVNGAVHLNAAAGQIISVRQGGASAHLAISALGNVIVGGESDLAPPGTAVLQVAGEAFKNQGSSSWMIPSDARLKEDVRDLEAGLAALRQLRPVRFRYNGRAGTSSGRAGVGVLAQEIETVLPETVQRASVPDDPTLDQLRIFDSSMLTYVLINAVKELAARVEHLEQALAAATVSAVDPGPVAA